MFVDPRMRQFICACDQACSPIARLANETIQTASRFRASIAVGLLLIGGVASAVSAQEAYDFSERYRPTPIPDRIVLSWVGNPATSQAVNWRTSTDVENAVAQFALAADGPRFDAEPKDVAASTQTFQSDQSEALFHTAHFEDLKPNTKYMYRVGDGVNWSEWSHFTTASDKDDPFTFIYFGDAQNDVRQRWSRVVREAYAEAPRADFMLHAGDLINVGTADNEWGEWFEAGGWIQRTMPTIATPGNHEYYTNRREERHQRVVTPHWAATFVFPQNGPEGVDGLSETCYYLDYQGARIIALDTNRNLGEQSEWLDKVLSESEQRWSIVTMHHPVYSAAAERDNPDVREAFQPIFDKHRVDIVLQGHDHTYARSRLMQGLEGGAEENVASGGTARGGKGTLYVVSVSGPKMYDLGYREFMERAAEDTQLFQVITVQKDKLIYEARTANGTLYDAFELVKREGESNELVSKVPETPNRRRDGE